MRFTIRNGRRIVLFALFVLFQLFLWTNYASAASDEVKMIRLSTGESLLNKAISLGDTFTDIGYKLKGIKEKSHTFSSSDSNVFSVSETGGSVKLESKKEGLAKLTLTVNAKNGNKYTDSAYISIYSPFDEVDAITTSRTLTTRSPRTGTENLNERGYVPKGTSIKVYGQCKGYYRINWENNTFDDGLGHGNGYIAKDDISIPVTEISVSSSDIIIRKGDSKKITATVAPTRATDKTLNWKSSSKKTASVDQNGNIKGVEKGTAKITANTGNKTASCMVSVYEEIKESTGKVKGYTREGCNIYKGAYNSGIVRTAAKHENLIIEGDAGSYYYVTADTDKASGFIEKSKIEIPVVKIVINSKKSEIKKGHKLKLTKTLFPTITTQTKGIWSSSNKSIAAVSQTGVLTPVKEGTFTVSYTINRKIGGKKKYNIVAPKRIGFTNHRNIPENKKSLTQKCKA